MMPVVKPIVEDIVWVPLVQQVVWDKVVVQCMVAVAVAVAVVVESFEVFVKFVACFVVRLVATKN